MEWKVYLADKTCYVFRDGELLDKFIVLKQQGNGLTIYSRANDNNIDSPPIQKMRLLATVQGDILYDRTKGLHFQGLAKKVDEAGEVAFVSSIPPEIVQSYKTIATLCLEEAKTMLRIGPAFKENARRILLEIDKYDPDNEEYQKLLKSITS